MDTTWLTESASNMLQAFAAGRISSVELVRLHLEQQGYIRPKMLPI